MKRCDNEVRRRRLGWLFHLVTLTPCHLVILLSLGCGLKPTPRPQPGEFDRLPRLETIQAQLTRMDVVTELTATVEALEKTVLCAQVRGVVKPLSPDMDIGRPVKKG